MQKIKKNAKMKAISSVNNDTIKNIIGLIQKSSTRRKSEVYVVEGKRELQLAEKSGFRIDKNCPEK